MLKRARTRGSLLSRLERLEVSSEALQPIRMRYGHLRQLSADYEGERQVVVTKQLPSQHGREWVEFEEVPGPAPVHECAPPDTAHIVDVDFVGREISFGCEPQPRKTEPLLCWIINRSRRADSAVM